MNHKFLRLAFHCFDFECVYCVVNLVSHNFPCGFPVLQNVLFDSVCIWISDQEEVMVNFVYNGWFIFGMFQWLIFDLEEYSLNLASISCCMLSWEVGNGHYHFQPVQKICGLRLEMQFRCSFPRFRGFGVLAFRALFSSFHIWAGSVPLCLICSLLLWYVG